MKSGINSDNETEETIKEALARLEMSKANFVKVAAHELRTPLTIIEGYSAIIRDAIRVNDQEDEYGKLIEGIDAGVRRLKEIINNMVTVSLIDNNLLELNYQPVWMHHLLMSAVAQVKPYAESRDQIILIQRFEGDNQYIFADAERITQSLTNVLLNAIKYTPDGGKIIIDGRNLASSLPGTLPEIATPPFLCSIWSILPNSWNSEIRFPSL